MNNKLSKYALLTLFLFASCSLIPSTPSMPSISSPVNNQPTTAVGSVMKETTDNVWQWVWISCLLVFVFPSMRAPLVGFLTALFTCLSLLPNHLIFLYNQKFHKK